MRLVDWIAVGIILTLLVLTSCPKAKADNEYVQYAQQMEQKYAISPGLLSSICETESNWRNVKGTKGEIGVCQLTPESLRMALGSPRTVDRPVVQYGSTGQAVKELQTRLHDFFPALVVDGIFGPITWMAVKDYQSWFNLKADGIVGKRTWTSLVGPQTYSEVLWNPKVNIEYAAKYLVWLKDKLKTDNEMIIAAAYNGGTGNPIVKYMLKVNHEKETKAVSILGMLSMRIEGTR